MEVKLISVIRILRPAGVRVQKSATYEEDLPWH